MTDGNAKSGINVSVAYALPKEQFWRSLSAPPGTTVLEAIEQSGVLSEFPAIDLERNKVGIFGRIVGPDRPLDDGDRVEIYRPITIDPERLPKRKYRLRKVDLVVEKAGATTTIPVPEARTIYKEEEPVSLAGLLDEYGFVVKVDVTDLDKSLRWYKEKLGFSVDERHTAGSWRQLTMPELPNTALGLYLNPDGAGLGGKKATFVVTDIEAVRHALIRDGVEVDEIVNLGDWVKLAFLRDPDGNVFGIRQNLAQAADGSE